MARSKFIATVEDTTQVAAKKASEAFIEAAERLAPLIDQAGDYLGPLTDEARRVSATVATDAYSRVKPVLRDARIRGARLASDAYDRVQPVIDGALYAVPPAVEGAVSKVRPAVDDALGQIPPLIEGARSKVQDEVLPKVAAVLKDAASQPLATEAAAQLALAAAAIAKESRKAAEVATGVAKKRSWPAVVGKVLLAGALLGGIVAIVRKLITPPTTGWHAHTPSDAYVANPAKTVVEDVAEAAAPLVEEVKETVEDVKETVADAVDEVKETAEEAAEALEEAVEEATAEATWEDEGGEVEGGDASPLADSPFGEGSYVGSEPPEGFVIKANSRSKRYREPGSSAYDRSSGDVWFDTVEHAEAAGFTKAQR